jgi:hypothetical protein
LSNSQEERVTTPRRCAWCLRFWAGETWVDGKRAEDEAVLPAATHTICDDCIEDLRRKGLSI